MDRKIEFYVPKGQKIPTTLKLRVDDEIEVIYEPVPNQFTYDFVLSSHDVKDSEEARKIVRDIAEAMCRQSYDHGAEWRITDMDAALDERYSLVTVRVYFRWKDSY